MVSVSRQKEEGLRVEQALDWDNREHVTTIGMATVVKADVALAAIEAGVAGVATALQLLASGIRRQDVAGRVGVQKHLMRASSPSLVGTRRKPSPNG